MVVVVAAVALVVAAAASSRGGGGGSGCSGRGRGGDSHRFGIHKHINVVARFGRLCVRSYQTGWVRFGPFSSHLPHPRPHPLLVQAVLNLGSPDPKFKLAGRVRGEGASLAYGMVCGSTKSTPSAWTSYMDEGHDFVFLYTLALSLSHIYI